MKSESEGMTTDTNQQMTKKGSKPGKKPTKKQKALLSSDFNHGSDNDAHKENNNNKEETTTDISTCMYQQCSLTEATSDGFANEEDAASKQSGDEIENDPDPDDVDDDIEQDAQDIRNQIDSFRRAAELTRVEANKQYMEALEAADNLDEKAETGIDELQLHYDQWYRTNPTEYNPEYFPGGSYEDDDYNYKNNNDYDYYDGNGDYATTGNDYGTYASYDYDDGY